MTLPARNVARAGRGTLLALGALVFFVYALSNSRERPWGDATPIFEVAESLVARGTVHVQTRWPADGSPGRGGHYYALNPIVPSLIHIPGVVMGRTLTRLFPQSAPWVRPMSSHVGPAAAGAITAVLFFLVALHLGASRRVALASTLLLAFGTPLWVYARSPYSEVSQIAAFTGLLLYLLRLAEAPEGTAAKRAALGLGLWAGLLVNTKVIYVTAFPGALVFLLWRWRVAFDPRARARAVAHLAWAALAFAPLGALLLGYNAIRFGSPFDNGYASGTFTAPFYAGLWGMIASPGKSILLYAPPLLLTLLALPRAFRERPGLLAAILVTALPPLAISGARTCWSGDYAWGPRYLVFAVPALLAPGVLALDRLEHLGGRLRQRAAVAAVAALGVVALGVQLLGNAFYWDHFIRITRAVTVQWLGAPQKHCPPPAPPGQCDSCFEDMFSLQWLPPFQPIAGHLWLLRHVVARDDWRAAAADAPWRRYTPIELSLADSYPRARIDHWLPELPPQQRALGVAIFVALAAGAAASALALARSLRSSRPLTGRDE